MLKIEINKEQVEEVLLEEIRKRLDILERHYVFWDMKTLCKVTCMSENFIKEQFFYHPDFPKYRVGRKWLMPAKECEEFLINWLKQHPKK